MSILYQKGLLVAVLLFLVLLVGGCVAYEPAPVVVEPEEEVIVEPGVGIAEPVPVRPVGVVGAPGGSMLLTQLLDEDVENRLDEDLGEMEDLLVDWSTGNVVLARVEHGGFLDIGNVDLAAPLGAMEWDPADDDFILSISEEAFETFPEIADDWPLAFTPGWEDQIAGFWEGAGFDVSTLQDVDPESLVWASDLIVYGVNTYNAAGLGNVRDLVIDLDDARVRYVALSFFDVGVYGEEWRFVPYDAFEPAIIDDTPQLVLTEAFDVNLLAEAPVVIANDLFAYDTFDPAWDDIYESYWIERGIMTEEDRDVQAQETPAVADITPTPAEETQAAQPGAANQVQVELIAYEIRMPETIPAGSTEFYGMTIK